MRHLKVGLLGCGTVGFGFLHVVSDRWVQDRLACLGIEIEVGRVLIRDRSKHFIDGITFTTNPGDITNDSSVDVVVEAVGGIEPARRVALDALANGKHFVTSNKALVAICYRELSEAAKEAGVQFLFEASVGGGVPIIRYLRDHHEGITQIEAVLNGTTNFILTRMEEGDSFQHALYAAQERGLAEKDPADDINGTDAALKLCILGIVGFGQYVHPAEIPRLGIEGLEIAAVRNAVAEGNRYRLIATATRGKILLLTVHPELVPVDSLLGRVRDAQNGFIVRDWISEAALVGEGAGGLPTGCAILDDLVWLAQHTRRA